jgi:hypothetical protein
MKKCKKAAVMPAKKVKRHLVHDIHEAKEGIAEDKGLIKALRGKRGRKSR